MMELEDMLGLDSSDFKIVGVQVPLPIIFLKKLNSTLNYKEY